MKIERLTAAGLERFREAIREGRESGWYDDSWFGAAGLTSTVIESHTPLPVLVADDKLGSTRALHAWMGDEALLARLDIWDDAGLWSWLAAKYMPVLTRRTDKVEYITEIGSYVLVPGRERASWRHKLASPVRMYARHGEKAQVVLDGALHTHGDMMEQVSAVKGILQSDAIIEVLRRFYWDEDRQERRSGTLSQTSAGSLRHFKLVLEQLTLTYDFGAMDADHLEVLLSDAFGVQVAGMVSHS